MMPFPMIPFPKTEQPPQRIQVALDYLNSLTFKTMPRAAINDISIEWADRVALTEEEVLTQFAALRLLRKYFGGKLKPDSYDYHNMPDTSMCIACPACSAAQRIHPTCQLCKGRGTTKVLQED